MGSLLATGALIVEYIVRLRLNKTAATALLLKPLTRAGFEQEVVAGSLLFEELSVLRAALMHHPKRFCVRLAAPQPCLRRSKPTTRSDCPYATIDPMQRHPSCAQAPELFPACLLDSVIDVCGVLRQDGHVPGCVSVPAAPRTRQPHQEQTAALSSTYQVSRVVVARAEPAHSGHTRVKLKG